MKVGFIGLGNMGSAMASSLLKAGHEVTVHNRTAAKAQPLVDQGAKFGAQIGDACRGDVVITMLADDAALESTVFGDGGILASLRKGTIHISCSTISVALSERLTEAHGKNGQGFAAAPVFGRPQAAAAAKLFIAAAGSSDILDACNPIFEAIGQKTFRFGGNPLFRQPGEAQRKFPYRIRDRISQRSHGSCQQGRTRSAPISGLPDIHAL